MYALKQNVVGFLAVLAMVIAPLTVQAAPQRPYDEQAFKAAQEASKPVLIEIHADWCPTCKAQIPILDKLSREPAYSGVERLRVDFDSQKNLVKRFKATTQSTLVLYKGKAEVARSVGETDEGRIRAMLDKAR
jgi:thioredoxin 1